MNPTVSATTTARAPGEADAAHRRIERGEELIGDVGIRAGERIEQRRLAGVGVADERQRGHRDLRAGLTAGGTLLLDFQEPPREQAHPLRDDAPVGLELRLAGPAQADAALLALEVGPAAHQAAADMLQLRQLHLELALVAAGALREDVEDQRVAIEHAPLGELLEIALLAGRERVVDEDHVRRGARGELFQLARLAAAHEITRIGARAPSGEGGDRHGPCGHGELGELLQVLRIHGSAQSQAHQYGTLTSPWAFEHSGFP